MCGRDGIQGGHSETIKFNNVCFLPLSIDLVDHVKDRLRHLPEITGYLQVQRIHSFLAIQEKENEIRFLNGHFGLLADLLEDALVDRGFKTTCVDEGEG